MKTRSILLTTMLSLTCLMAGPAIAGGHTAAQLARAGFDCIPAGPSNWIHCMDLDKMITGKKAVPVLVFSVDGSEYLGTEFLLHQDVYAGQPCPQDDLNLWGPLEGTPYMTCHHFLTGHH